MSMGLWTHSLTKVTTHTETQTHTHTHTHNTPHTQHTHTHTHTHIQWTLLTNYTSARAMALGFWRRWHWVYMALYLGTSIQPHSQLSLWSPSSFTASSNTICYFWFYPSSLVIPLPEHNFLSSVCVCVWVCVCCCGCGCVRKRDSVCVWQRELEREKWREKERERNN